MVTWLHILLYMVFGNVNITTPSNQFVIAATVQ